MKKALLTAASAALSLTACGSHAQTVPAAASKQWGTMSLALKVPYPQSGSVLRSPKYISPGTQSVRISIAGAPTITANVTPGSPNCAATSGATLCTWNNVGAPIGQAYISVDAFDKPITAGGGTQGDVLSSGGTTASIIEGRANSVQLTMGGVAAKAAITSLDTNPVNGTATDLHFALNIMDADGYTIVGSAPYALAQGGTNVDPVGVSIMQPYPAIGSYDFDFVKNGVNYGSGFSIAAPSDTYSITYHGYGLISATLNVEKSNMHVMASATIAPKPAVAPVPGAPAIEASAKAVQLDPDTIWFTEPSKKSIAHLSGGVVHEIPLTSGHTPTLLNFATGTTMVFATQEGTIGLVSDNGVTEYTPPSNSPIGGVGFEQYPGSDIIFTQPALGTVSEMNMSGYFTSFTLPAGAAPGAVGMLNSYFVDPGTNSIGIVSSTGGAQEFPLPTAGSQPSSIAWGPGSTLWITEAGAKRVARMDPQTHTIVEYPTADILTSIDTADESALEGATDAAGNVEYFDTTGKETTFATGSAGPATQIMGTYNGESFPYLCPTCTAGIQDFLY